MSFDSAGPLQALAELVKGLADPNGALLFPRCYIGVPLGFGKDTVGAYVALAPQTLVLKGTQLAQRDATYYVAFCYQVGTSQQTAEVNIAIAVDSLIKALLADLSLGGLSLKAIAVSIGLSQTPTYQHINEQEYRVYPITITVTQQDTFKANL